MIISPLNVEAFYFKELPEEVKLKVINNKITMIIKNLEHKHYKKYKDTIELHKSSSNCLNYRELIKKYNSKELISDILKDNRLYDIYGNMFNIVYKNGEFNLFLTKTTSIPVKVISDYNYNISFNENDLNKELPIIQIENLDEVRRKIAKQFAISKFEDESDDESLDKFIDNI